jgi:hypothetical protein
MKVKQNFLSEYKWILITFGLIAISICYLLYRNLVWPIVELLERTPEPISIYSEITVTETCRLLKLDDDRFCSDPLHQTPLTFARALRRKFSVLNTTHDEIMGALRTFQSIRNQSESNFRADGCHPPSEKINYTCIVIFPGEIGMVWIDFDRSGRVSGYLVQGMLGGT